jgi:hypothetical protein
MTAWARKLNRLLSAEWKGKKLPWDLDCNVSTSHVYRGLVLIR